MWNLTCVCQVVFFGTNDSIVPESASNNSVPVEKYQENLRKIVSAAEKVGAKVILIGPGPFNHQQFDDALGHQFEVDRTTHRAREYCNATVDVGKELGVPTVPMWDLIMEEVGWKEGDPIYGLPELPAVNPLNDYLTDGMCCPFANERSCNKTANESFLQACTFPALLTRYFSQMC